MQVISKGIIVIYFHNSWTVIVKELWMPSLKSLESLPLCRVTGLHANKFYKLPELRKAGTANSSKRDIGCDLERFIEFTWLVGLMHRL